MRSSAIFFTVIPSCADFEGPHNRYLDQLAIQEINVGND